MKKNGRLVFYLVHTRICHSKLPHWEANYFELLRTTSDRFHKWRILSRVLTSHLKLMFCALAIRDIKRYEVLDKVLLLTSRQRWERKTVQNLPQGSLVLHFNRSCNFIFKYWPIQYLLWSTFRMYHCARRTNTFCACHRGIQTKKNRREQQQVESVLRCFEQFCKLPQHTDSRPLNSFLLRTTRFSLWQCHGDQHKFETVLAMHYSVARQVWIRILPVLLGIKDKVFCSQAN